MRRRKGEEEKLREEEAGREGGREAGCQQWKSTADSSNPRSLSQLGTIVMESLRQNLKRKPLQQQALLLCQLTQKAALHHTSAFVCAGCGQ